jgi:hypothetical protein
MRKKILVFTFLVFMMMITPYTSSISISNEQQNLLVKSKEYVDLNYENTTTYIFMTLGPTDSTISEITYQKGTFLKNSSFWFSLIFTILFRFGMFLHPLTRPIGFYTFDKIDFTVEYKQDIPQGSEVGYLTNITEIVNGTLTNNTIQIMNEKHTVKVEGFFGALVLFKKSRIMPPHFFINGFCEKYTIIQ